MSDNDRCIQLLEELQKKNVEIQKAWDEGYSAGWRQRENEWIEAVPKNPYKEKETT